MANSDRPAKSKQRLAQTQRWESHTSAAPESEAPDESATWKKLLSTLARAARGSNVSQKTALEAFADATPSDLRRAAIAVGGLTLVQNLSPDGDKDHRARRGNAELCDLLRRLASDLESSDTTALPDTITIVLDSGQLSPEEFEEIETSDMPEEA